uniref:Uncharacterized protein n=1 Tax=Arundo donax TaxID=35708 RepID=A0A0A9BIY6_ARUDO
MLGPLPPSIAPPSY